MDKNGLDLFRKAIDAVFNLEQHLMEKEKARVCSPIYRMRIGLDEFSAMYKKGVTICDKQTVHEIITGKGK